MCGRYAFYSPTHVLKSLFGLENLLNAPARYNCAPMQKMPIIVRGRMGVARWGFRPDWARDENDAGMAAKMINCRSETVHEKPAFRDAWARGRRCLVPADGFYEWHTGEDGVKQPYYIHKSEGMLCFAGLWSKCETAGGALVTYTMLTKPADGAIADLHHRMPVMLNADQAGEWFAGSEGDARGLIDAASGADLAFHKVARDVGKVANDSPDLIEQLAA